MKLSSHKLDRRNRFELSMTSMIDVVFLLLIFFMTTSNFVLTERNLDSTIKVDRGSSNAPSELEPVIIEVVRVDDEDVFRLGGRTLKTADELTQVLSSMPPTDDGAFVRVADDAPFGMAAAAIQACRAARILMVSYIPMETTQ
ncbi:MAG: biopolymer transporter ExbD [Planctomycetales bacterium]|nr:biopolymer transporter ExbD [Planctomycetales bacterium]